MRNSLFDQLGLFGFAVVVGGLAVTAVLHIFDRAIFIVSNLTH